MPPDFLAIGIALVFLGVIFMLAYFVGKPARTSGEQSVRNAFHLRNKETES